MPEFMSLMEAEAKKRILDEVTEKIRDHVTELVENMARDIIAQKLDLYPPKAPAKSAEPEELAETEVKEPPSKEMKTDLAEEILSLPADEALRKLKLSLAKGEIDEETYQELKELVEPESPQRNVCPHCGKELEPGVNFCRFCGSKVT